MTKFQFGNVVVVEGGHIGVVVKSWGPSAVKGIIEHEVYVRSFKCVKTYKQEDISHFIYSKELSEEETEFYQ